MRLVRVTMQEGEDLRRCVAQRIGTGSIGGGWQILARSDVDRR
jgi:hypothetical protein